jgi:thiol-disulfide isomerase/thioredoxin
MVQTASDMLPLGTPAPHFCLEDAVSGHKVYLDEQPADRPLLVMFICNHCPYVVHVRAEFARLQDEYEGRLSIVAINSNSTATHPEDGPKHMKELALTQGWRFPFLFDSLQEVAHAYHAACTPDFFLFGPGEGHSRTLVYRGQLDGSRPGNDVPVTGRDLRHAIDAVLAGRAPEPDQKPSLGCNIKWTPGNEPDYFRG